MRRKGILTLVDIMRILDREFKDPSVDADLLREHEPVLDDNLTVWCDVEVKRLDDVFVLTQPVKKAIKNMLKRYFIRGYMMHRDIGAKTLDNMIGQGG